MLRTLLASLLLLASSTVARAQDGAIDEETLLENALPRVESLYLHPDAIDPVKMLRAGLQALEHQSPRLLVLEEGEDALRIEVDGQTRVVPVDEVQDLAAAFATFESVSLWVDPLLDDPEVDLDDLRTAALSGALRTLDRHSRVIAGDSLDDFNTRFRGELFGIGATIGRRDDRMRVVKPFADAPAGRAGLQAWDAITHVDGVSTEAMSVNDAVERIRGPEGVPVVLTVERDGEDHPRIFVIVRDKVRVPSVDETLLSGNIGYVEIGRFSKKTSEEFVAALQSLREQAGDLKGLVLDLRGNQGGSMVHAARIVNAFSEEGLLVQTEGSDGNRVSGLTWKIPAQAKYKHFDGPVVVLVDESTASGSEIVAGGLKFLNRGLILGHQTFGKGTVQKVYSLADDVSMKLTVARYLLPGERYINSVGVTPDVMTGQFWLDGGNPTVPDAFVEPASLAGLEALDGGLDERHNPGAGRAPTTDASNRTPTLRLAYPRILDSWLAAQPAEGEATPAPEQSGPPPEATGDARVRSRWPGDVGDAVFNDLELRLAHEILLASKPTDRRAALLSIAGPLVAQWAERQSERLKDALAEREVPWTPTTESRWLDRSPGSEAGVEARLLSPPPPLSARLELPEALVAGEEYIGTLVVKNTGEVTYERLRARLESSTGALDDASFVLGDLPPGAERRASITVNPSSRAASRLDTWRLYLIDDGGPLGGPFQGTVRTKGLPDARLSLRLRTELVAEPGGAVTVQARVEVRNEGPEATGDVRVLFGDPDDDRVERRQRWQTLEELSKGQVAGADLTLHVRDAAAVPVVSGRVIAQDMKTGSRTTVELEVPTGIPLEWTDWRIPPQVDFVKLPKKAMGISPVEGTVVGNSPLAAVEVLVGGDKLFSRRVPEGEEVRAMPFDIAAPVQVGPNAVHVRIETRDGVSRTETAWVLGEPE